jgi:hypothetical protein
MDDHISRMFENRVLRRIFGPKREEVAGGWRIMIGGECSTHGRDKKCIQYFGWKI